MIEYLQAQAANKIEKVGFQIEWFGNYDIWNVVVDIIGFPRDNTLVYDFHYLNTGERGDDPSLKVPDDEMFCRDWLSEEWFQVITKKLPESNVISDYKGLRIADPDAEALCISLLESHVDWLYSEFEEWSKDWSTSIIRRSMNNDE